MGLFKKSRDGKPVFLTESPLNALARIVDEEGQPAFKLACIKVPPLSESSLNGRFYENKSWEDLWNVPPPVWAEIIRRVTA